MKQRALRRQQRAAFGSLKQSQVKPGTYKLYEAALVWFFQWMDREGLVLPSEVVNFEDLVCECIEAAWDSGEPRALIGNLLSALPFMVSPLYGNLKGAWKLWKLWGEREILAEPRLSPRMPCWASATTSTNGGFTPRPT